MFARRVLWVLAMALVLGSGATLASEKAGGAWTALSASQKAVLGPLESDWTVIDARRQQKWLELAARFPGLPVEEQQRIRARMSEWSRLSPAERASARLQFQESRQLPSEQRQARWQEYQALPPEEKAALARQAKPAPKGETDKQPAAAAAGAAASPEAKRNLVQSPSPPATKAAGPVSVQGKPGATTTSITSKAVPPAHHQPGLPMIAATPGFVNPSTLLPQRGPQGAAVQSAAASEPAAQP